ncbi:hypothetical protein [Edaphocola aurantiacus]|uniref:hypothetical protein n=1 Tax=Edaphocola aurantiacus TaxID=2601682 RepID=UPI001C971FA2|nr:hypothetical protein [Edaphocola aurantiacus]
MKKLFIALSMILLGGSMSAIAQSKPAETKASILKSIRSQIVKEMLNDGTSKEKSEKFGDCFVKDLSAKMNLEELKVLYKLNAVKSGQAPPKELLKQAEKMGLPAKMQDMGKDCASIFGE